MARTKQTARLPTKGLPIKRPDSIESDIQLNARLKEAIKEQDEQQALSIAKQKISKWKWKNISNGKMPIK